MALLASVRQALGAGSAATLFVETPCAEWILAHAAMHDLFYEHCSLFTAQALRHALAAGGFGDATMSHVFGGQYLWASARAGGGADATAWPARTPLGSSGAKGISFALLVDPDADIIDHAVDINPAKQGLFLAGTGLPVLAPDQSAARRPSSILVMNPNYTDEVRALASLGNKDAALIPLT